MPLIEEGWANSSVAHDIASIYLNPLKNTNIDTLILGCTHYPIMKKTIQNIVSNNIKLIPSGKTIGYELNKYLNNYNLINKGNKVNTIYYVTDFPQKFDEIGSNFLEEKLTNIKLISI